MPKYEEILGKYGNQKNRDENIHTYDLSEEISPEICLDMTIGYTDDEYVKDQTSLNVRASTTATNSVLIFGATIDSSKTVSNFIFGDTFGNEGKGKINLASNPINLKLEVKEMRDEGTLPYYTEYDLYKV